MCCTIRQIAKYILLNPAPVLIVDTCSVLDIFRALNSGVAGVDTIRQANIALDYLKFDPQKYHLVISSSAFSEISNQKADAQINTKREVRRIIDSAMAYQEIASSLLSEKLETHFSDIDGVLGKIDGLIADLIRLSFKVDEEDYYLADGVRRAARLMLPAQKGLPYADSIIFAEVKALCGLLSAEKFGRPMVLLSSNKRDFDPNDRRDPERRKILKDEYSVVNLLYTSDWGWAIHALGL